MKKRRLFMAAGMSTLLIATLMPASVAGRSPERFGRVDLEGLTADLEALARNRDPGRTVNVIVELAGAPVAAAIGAALDAGRELSEAERAALRQPLISRQATLKTQLRTLGARVQGSYTDVLNGVRISVRAGQLPRIAALPGVVKVSETPTHFRTNTNTVRYLRADRTWGSTGFTGEGVNLAVIDSGINYYHPGFGGIGNPQYQNDDGLSRADGNFPTDKVIAGHDFVGDDYNPSDDDPTNDDPEPDNDPLDCKDPASPNVQHGSHVAGTAAGFGMLEDDSTYTGPYDEDTLANVDFKIGPGTAPEANLMAYRVFGCDGGTNLVVDAIERAVRDGADVINMSLGSPFGNLQSSDAVAVDNASIAGVTVVMSAGNNGPSAYITGSPGVATRGISVAAMDADPSFPSVVIDMATGDDIVGINANGETTGLPVTGELNVFEDNPATPCDADTGEGCEEAGTRASAYVFNAYVEGQIPVTFRGRGARVDRAKEGDAQGAPAVIMVNNSSSLPPFEGPIGDVDIPFVGVSGDDGARFFADEGEEATISEGPELPNENFKHTASFTSGGPRRFDNQIKPDVVAPGVGVFSVAGETVNNGKSLSGTSMASPAVAGVAALVQQANPSWTPREIKAAIIGTAKPSRVDPYEVRLSGAGVVNPKKAVRASNFAFTTPGLSSLSYGYQELDKAKDVMVYEESRSINIVNDSSSARTYRLRNTFQTDSLGADVSISPSVVTVAANSRRMVSVTISFSRADAAALPDIAPDHGPDLTTDDFGQLFSPLTHVAGAVIAKPTSGGNSIRVPWLIVPRGISRIGEQPKEAYTEDADSYDTSVRVRNYGLHDGIVDVFQWGLQDGNDGLDGIDIRAAGVQSLPTEVCTGGEPDETDECLVFAVNTWDKWNNASDNEFDILIDTDGDEELDYAVIGIDAGPVFGTLDGVYISLILDLDAGVVGAFFATAPNNGTTMLLPVLASELGLEEGGDDDFEYFAQSFDFYDDDGTLTQFDTATTGIHPTNGSELAHYRAFDPVLSNNQFVPLAPGDRADIPLSVNKDGYDPDRGHKGWMLVTLEDGSLDEFDVQFQADLVPVGALPE